MQELEIKKIELSIQDIESCRTLINQRHKDNPSFMLRIDSVFNQLINTLRVLTGNGIKSNSDVFKSIPINKFLGKTIKVKSKNNLKLPNLSVDEVEAFKEKIQLIYNSFPSRNNTDLLDSLDEIEIRGVAKLAGIENFDKISVDGILLDNIKLKIQQKQELEEKQEQERQKLEEQEKLKIQQKQELEEKPKSVKK